MSVMNDRSILISSAVMSASADSEFPEHRQNFGLEMGFCDEGVFRDLDHEARRISGRLKRLRKRAHEIRIAGLLRRDVDADGGIGAEAFVDEIDRLDDLRQHQMSKLVDQPEFHRQIDECAGGLNDAVVVAQPYQCLDALDIL